MIILALGLVVFFALHSLTVMPATKLRLIDRLGRRSYYMLFGAVATAALLIIIMGWRHANFVPVYDPGALGWYVNYTLNLLAFLCLGIFLFRGSWRQSLRFPLAIATIVWGLGHLCANGDLRGIILFGGMCLGMSWLIMLGVINHVRPSTVVHKGHNGLSLLAGVALYGVMTQLHPLLMGVPVFAM